MWMRELSYVIVLYVFGFACICIIWTQSHVCILIQNYIISYIKFYTVIFCRKVGSVTNINCYSNSVFSIMRKQKRVFMFLLFRFFWGSFIPTKYKIVSFSSLYPDTCSWMWPWSSKVHSCPIQDSLYYPHWPLFKHFHPQWYQSVTRDGSEGGGRQGFRTNGISFSPSGHEAK